MVWSNRGAGRVSALCGGAAWEAGGAVWGPDRCVIHTGEAEPGTVVGHEPGLLPAALAPRAKEPAAGGRVSVRRVSMSRVQV